MPDQDLLDRPAADAPAGRSLPANLEAEAAFLGDRITLLRAGRIVQQGEFHDLLERPADEFVTKFVRAQRQLVS